MSQGPSEGANRPEKKDSQFKALFLKNAQLQAKQPCTNCCQIMTPVICLIFTFLIKKLATDNLPNGTLYADSTYPYVFDDNTLFDSNSLRVDAMGQPISGSPSRNNPLQWYLYQCVDKCPESQLLGAYSGQTPQSTPDGLTLLSSIPNDKSQFQINNVSLNYYSDQNTSIRYLPFFIPTNSTINEQVYDRVEVVEGSDFKTIKNGRDGLDTVPDGAISFKEVTPAKLNVTLRINNVRDLDLHRNNGVTNVKESKRLKDAPIWQSGIKDIITPYGMLKLQHMVVQAYGYLVTSLASTPKTFQSGYIFTRDTESTKSFVDSIINTVSALIFPIALSLLFPVMLYGLVLQKEEKLVQMMKMNGMKITNYWLVYFLFNFLLCIATNLVFFLLGAFALNTSFFTKTHPFLLIVVALGWSISQIGMAAFFQTFLSKSRSANIIGYIIAIWTMMVGSTLSVGVYQTPSEFPGWMQAVPPLAFNRLFYLMLINCSDADCYNYMSEVTPEMTHCILSLYLVGLLLFLLGAYLMQVLPQQFGVSRHPLFPFIDFYRFITCKKQQTYARPQKDHELKKYMSDQEEDPSSVAERENTSKMKDIDDSPLIINNLRKLYKKQGYSGPYPAVKSFNLKIRPKETFGLLGPNGAGKTTLISMLTGMVTPNYGNAWIGGYDIQSNISRAQLQMGVCPQFDLLWPQLTVEEHLRFYARLKGTPSEKLQEKIDQAIAEVNLTPFRVFLSSSLSGGMKRRLSIAISLVGDPQLVFLDEPSTGLDPDNRRQIWQVLAKCQEKRALFLTTHIMEEADALCNRIGIITHGTLRTVGTQIRLKKQYGEGYRLGLSLIQKEKQLISPENLNVFTHNTNLQAENEDLLRRSIHQFVDCENIQEHDRVDRGLKEVQQYILTKFPGSTKARAIGQSLIFKIPASFKISEMFVEMNTIEKELKITNISITESSLEDVFIAVVLKYDKIMDDPETGQPQLVSPNSNEEDFDGSHEEMLKSLNQPLIKEREIPAEDKFGSVLEKDRVSELSEEGYKPPSSDNRKPESREDDSDEF